MRFVQEQVAHILDTASVPCRSGSQRTQPPLNIPERRTQASSEHAQGSHGCSVPRQGDRAALPGENGRVSEGNNKYEIQKNRQQELQTTEPHFITDSLLQQGGA